jgi:hypothetical protein
MRWQETTRVATAMLLACAHREAEPPADPLPDPAECSRLGDVIWWGSGYGPIDHVPSGDDIPPYMLELATDWSARARQLDPMQVSSRELQQVKAHYRSVVQHVADTARRLAAAGLDRATSQKELARAFHAHDPVMEEHDRVCANDYRRGPQHRRGGEGLAPPQR